VYYNIVMSENVTKQDLVELKRDLQGSIDKAVEDLSEVIANLAQQMHTELVEIKSDNRDTKDTLNRLMNSIDGFVGRIDKYETELAARDSQIEKLISWARKVSEKTGVPLENL